MHHGSPLFYAGIDEAGYGPRLGPLCVAMSLFRVDGWTPGGPAPDLWKLLREVVAREPADARKGKLPVNDSKRLKMHGPGVAHAVQHLERGVLAFLHAQEPARAIDSDAALLAALGAAAPSTELPWYAGLIDLPCSTTLDHARVQGSRLAGACERAGVTPMLLRAELIDESAFNQGVERERSKAAVSFDAVARLLRMIWEGPAAAQPSDGGPRVIIDRQGGRAYYAQALARAIPDCEIIVHEERDVVSRYELRGSGPLRVMTVQFRVEAEKAHLPVALASMTAKLLRELMMERFNRYWCARCAELKPTAGYATDAGRWLRDVRAHTSAHELHAMVRRA